MAVKLLISGLAGSGKTTLLNSLEDVLVISHDGKAPNIQKPHAYVKEFSTVDELCDIVQAKVMAYKEKFGKYPSVIAFDSVSKIFDTISNNCNKKFTGFTIYSELNKQVNQFNTFLENDIASAGVDLVILSHALYDGETENYKLVAQGKFADRGGYFAEVNEGIFIVAKGSKRTIHLRSTKFPARTLNDDFPESVESADFSLQEHIESLRRISTLAEEFAL